VAYLRCLPPLKKVKLEGDRQTGVEIVMKAIEEPIRQIAQNVASVASLLITTEAVVAEKQKKEAFSPMPPEY
jgi:chaperonin GroEL